MMHPSDSKIAATVTNRVILGPKEIYALAHVIGVDAKSQEIYIAAIF
jgi:hypothetical protein